MAMRRAMVLAVASAVLAAGCGGGASSSSTPSSTSAGTTSSAEVTTSTSETTSTDNKGIPGLGKVRRKLSKPASPATVVRYALSAGPSALACHLYTDSLLKAAYGDLNGCIAAIKSGGSAKSVKIVSSDTSGSTATVVAMPSGGPSSGEKLTYTLVMADGAWRLDQVKSNVKVGP